MKHFYFYSLLFMIFFDARLYWKDNGLFKQAMLIKFHESDLETVKEIIETISTK